MKVKKRRRISLFSLLIIALLIVGIGYASINSVILEMAGTVRAEVPKNVFITNVQYVSDVDANTTNSKIKNYLGTMMQSTVELSKTNPNSEIVYKVTVYNNSTKTGTFLDVIYDQANYDNQDIVYEIQDTGFKLYDTIAPKEKKDILIKFKYKDSTLATNNVLNSYLNFKIAEPNMLKQVTSSGNYFGAVDRTKIEKISFELGTIPKNYTQSFDASANQDKSIMGYVTDTDSNNMYEITFSSDDPIFANTNSSALFAYLAKLTNISFNNFRTITATNMSDMFGSCSSLTSLDLNSFNTSKVTNMSDMFYDCNSLTSLDLSNFDTGNVTNMSMMFAACRNLTNLALSNFNTKNVTNMSSMFHSCNNLASLNLSNFDTSNVTDMPYMFYSCRKLTSLNVSNFNTENVTNMSSMFSYCSSLTSLDVSSFNTSKVPSMSYMFSNCSKLTSLNVSNFNTENVTDISYMFYYCSSLTSLDVSSFNTSKVTDMSDMFSSCSKLTTIYVKNKFNTDKVTSSSNMFKSCTSLIGGNGTVYNSSYIDKTYARIDKSGTPGYFTMLKKDVFLKKEVSSPSNFLGIGDRINITKVIIKDSTSGAPTSVTDISEDGDKSIIGWIDGTTLYIASDDNIFTNVDSSNLFSYIGNCSAIEGLENLDTSKTTNMSDMFSGCNSLTSLDISNFNTSNVSRMSSMFDNCYKLTSLDVSSFDTSNVTDMLSMFRSCSSLTSLDVSNFDTSNVSRMSSMFYYCVGLTSLDVSSFNTSNVSRMSSMFDSCYKLTSLDVSSFNTSNVTDMSSMFDSCSSLTSLDVSSFDTSKVRYMSYMFAKCSKLTTIYASDDFITDKVTNSTNMFTGCTSSLKGGNGTYFNSNYTDKTYARIDKSGTPGYFTKLVTYNAPAIIPNGFVASQATGEKDVSTGLVIYEGTTPVTDSNVATAKKTRNQFVWIPVDDISDFVRVDGYKNGSKQSLVSSCSEPYTNATAEEISEYNAMIASVEKYHGFYIARYEASQSSSGKAQSMSNQSPWVKMRWGGSMRVSSSSDAVEVSRAVYNSASAEKDPVSTLVYGVQWDQTVRFLKQNYSDIETDSKNYGNYKNSKLTFINSSGNSVTKASGSVAVVPTGNTEHSKTNNIYDMAGNIEEWTMEAYSTTCRVTRGGNWSYNGTTVYSISSRNTWTPTDKTAGSDLRL